jgi:hypothetical protein
VASAIILLSYSVTRRSTRSGRSGCSLLEKFVGFDNYQFIIDNPQRFVANTHLPRQQPGLADSSLLPLYPWTRLRRAGVEGEV